MTTIFKTEFKNGQVNYGTDSAVKTPEAFINARKCQGRNQRDTDKSLRTFNRMLLEEVGYETTIVGSGSKSKMDKLVTKLREQDVNCINSRSNVEKTKRNDSTVIKLKKEFVKNVGPMTFIDKNKGIKMGLMDVMNFRTLHPLNSNYCLINSEIKIVG